jgi:hypothetical protein
MKLVEKFKPVRTGHHAYDRMQRLAFSAPFEKILASEAAFHDDRVCRYSLWLQLGITFHCSENMFDRALKNARQQLVNELFGDLNSIIYAAINAVFEGDREKALGLLEELSKELRP